MPDDQRWFVGDATGLEIPADARAFLDGGANFLTTAFQRYGALAADNAVTAVTQCDEIEGGSTGRKLLLAVDYEKPGPLRQLFVKFSRDFGDPVRDHGRRQMEPEIRFAALSRAAEFPIVVPTTMFADHQAASGTGVLISERIPFGVNGIEPQHQKCMDYAMTDQLAHYRALFTSIATLAGTQKAGLLDADGFHTDIEQLSVGERVPLTAERLARRVARLAEFAERYPGLLPANVRSPAFLTRLRTEIPKVLAAEPLVWRHLREQTDYVALCHWNANVDNAWFWRDGDGMLQCGLMDWGCVGPMNVAMAVWGSMCSAETALWNDEFVGLLDLFAGVFRASGGPDLDTIRLRSQVVLYAAVMAMTWLLDVPSYVVSQIPGLDETTTRMDPAIQSVESVRCRLQMMTNALNLWEASDVEALLPPIRRAESR